MRMRDGEAGKRLTLMKQGRWLQMCARADV